MLGEKLSISDYYILKLKDEWYDGSPGLRVAAELLAVPEVAHEPCHGLKRKGIV